MKKSFLLTLESLYSGNVQNGKILDEAESMIVYFFKRLEDRLAEVIKYSEGEVKIEFGVNDEILRITVKDNYLSFKRNGQKYIKIYMSKPLNIEGEDSKQEEYSKIVPVQGHCKMGAFEFNEAEVEELLKKAFSDIWEEE